MPLTIIPASHKPKPHPPVRHAKSLKQFLLESCTDFCSPLDTKGVASSFRIGRSSPKLYPSSSSLLRSAVEAWSRHSHLVLRPEDFWFNILSQISIFFEFNPESVKDLFISSTKAKHVIECSGERWDDIPASIQTALREKIKAEWLCDWVNPGFTTSTIHDHQTAAVLLMGLTKGHFTYNGKVNCGIPSITLLGEKKDWQRLLEKTERLAHFGDEPKDFARRLRPILSRIVGSFDSAADADTQAFWNQMVQATVDHSQPYHGKPPAEYYISGWIVALFYWNFLSAPTFCGRWGLHLMDQEGPLVYDGIVYPSLSLSDLPPGFARATIKMSNRHPGPRGAPWSGYIVAGNIGNNILEGAPDGYKTISNSELNEQSIKRGDNKQRGVYRHLRQNGDSQMDCTGHSTIQPTSGWILFGPAIPTPFLYHPPDEGTHEVSGPTVDAINSCDGIHHISARPGRDPTYYNPKEDGRPEKKKRFSISNWFS